jgi:hypothetical protein
VGLTYSRAKNAFWLGFFAFFCCGLFLGIPAIWVGNRALGDISRSGGRLKGRGTAWVGIILGLLGTLSSLSAGAYEGPTMMCHAGLHQQHRNC